MEEEEAATPKKAIKYCIVNHSLLQKVSIIEFLEFDDALIAAGLTRGRIDFGSITQNITIVVYEYGLFEPPEKKMQYFAIGRSLFAGGAVIFQTELGETVDYDRPLPNVQWYDDVEAVEAAIRIGKVIRPEVAINGLVTWSWNRPKEKA